MRLLTILLALLVSTAALADKQLPLVATIPKVGAAINVPGGDDWPKQQWMYEAPSPSDAAGKVVIYWFCALKIQACVDDLARIVTLRDTNRAYIIAFINAATARDAKKLDPIRESEGVGRGTVAFGKGAAALFKQLAITGPVSVVVDVDNKVALVSATGDDLDARDAKVNALIGAIKDFTTSQEGPTTVKVGDKFNLTLKIQLANWLKFSATTPKQFDISAPKDIKCDPMTLKGDQIKTDGHVLTATVSCSAPKGVYQAQGRIRFGYDAAAGAGLSEDGVTWKFEVK